MTDDFPRRRAATRGFRLGAPRNFAISPSGNRLVFLRSDGPTDAVHHLWLATWDDNGLHETKIVDAGALLGGAAEELPPAERARRERLRESSTGITAYSVDTDLHILAFVLSGDLFVHDLAERGTRRLTSGRSFTSPAIDPTGRRISASEDGSLSVVDITSGAETVLRRAGGDTEQWGTADFIAAEELERYAGLWWAPDGEALLATQVDEAPVGTWYVSDPALPAVPPTPQRYPAAGSANADVRLHRIRLDGSAVEVLWDRERFEYLARVHWSSHGDPVIVVANRAQTEVVTYTVDASSGRLAEVALEADDRWVELVGGAPRMTAGGLATVAVDVHSDTRRLTVHGGRAVRTPPGLQVHAITSDDDEGLVLSGSQHDPATCDSWRLTWDGGLERLTEPGGWSTARAAGGTTVRSTADLSAPVTVATVHTGSGEHVIRSVAETPSVSPRPEFLQIDDWSRIAVLLPQQGPHDALPIIMSPYGGPHAQRSIKAAAAFTTEQWLADQGYCVVVADGPGSRSRPANEVAIKYDLATGPLTGQVTALAAVVEHYGRVVDAERVGIRGWSFGGYLAALAVLERPDLFHVAVAGAPVTDWTLYDTAYTERYLGTPQSQPAAYAQSSLIERAAELERPLLLVHGSSDDNVVFAHTLRLSAALLAAGKQHFVLPLSGITHMSPQEVVAENLMRTELEFLSQHLRPGAPSDGRVH